MYYGDFIWKDKIHVGVHEPIINKVLWKNVQDILDSRENRGKQAKWGTRHFTFKGLLECGECHRTVTGDKKTKSSGKEYVYYRCTKYKSECSQKPVNENAINEQIEQALKDIELPKDTVDYITEALKDSLDIKRDTTDRERKRLEDRKIKLMTRLDRLYEDKLDNNITEDFYNRKFNEYTEQVTDLDSRISNYTQADIDYYRYGSGILELAHKASKLYRMANDEEKRELLGYLLSNCQLIDKKLVIEYRKPFEMIMKRNTSFRTSENSLTKAKNTLSGALPSVERTGRDSNPQLPP
ncbi:recombinase zinc beta ribbon domain-containing protein [Patescibacteria group bacterium]|nr:recombinase zinc beta ribbon domain-containing protein [Patescibacteria group bacterium]MBU1721873.1 recombinase zinc beta ribbon domain-containing protein [Patescibacteria group bacterium]MBU1901331.1 recombinase zinc beta ribbon domain-containing protein [Patescibacteria group bacterium]